MIDRYPILKALGAGYGGATWLVQDISQTPPTPCVLKQVMMLGSQDFQAWVAQVRNLPPTPALPQVLDAFIQGDRAYLVEEFIDGPSLATQLARQGCLPSYLIWKLLTELLPILASLHQHQIIHGDLKPANLIARSSPVGIITLVGLGTLPWVGSPSVASSKSQRGDPEYAAPEQLWGQVFPASDLYSLGVTCIQLLTDIRPFELLDGLEGTCCWQSYWLSSDDEVTRPALQKGLATLLDRLVAPALNDRFPSAQAALQVLRTLPTPSHHHPTASSHYSPASSSPLRPSTFPRSNASPWCTIATLPSHPSVSIHANALAISPDGRWLASGGEDKTLRCWDFNLCLTPHHPHLPIPYTLSLHQPGAIRALAFSPDSHCLASGGYDRVIKLWNPVTGEMQCTLEGHQQAVNALQFSPSAWLSLATLSDQIMGINLLFSVGTDKRVYLWNIETGEPVATLKGHLLAVTAIACHPSQPLLATASQDRTIKLWDLTSLQPRLTLTEHTWPVRTIAFSPDGSQLASGGDDNTIRIWEIPSGRCLRTISGHGWAVTSLAFSPDGATLISSSWDKTVKLWRVKDGQELALLAGHQDSVNAVVVAPNGVTIVSASNDKTLRLWQKSSYSGTPTG